MANPQEEAIETMPDQGSSSGPVDIGAAYQGDRGNPATSGTANADEQLSTKSTTYETVDINPRGALRLGTKMFRDVGVWTGRDGDSFKFSIKDNSGNEFYFNGAKLVSSNLTLSAALTAGHGLQDDWQVAVSAADGKVYPMRPTSVASLNTALGTTATGGALTAFGKTSSYDMSGTVKVFVTSTGSGAASTTSTISRIAITATDPTTATITSATISAALELDTDSYKIDSTRIFTVSLASSGNREASPTIFSGLDTTITANVGPNLSSANNTSVVVEGYSSTMALAFYTDTTSTTTVRFNNPTFNGASTITNGTQSNLFTTAATVKVRRVRKFGTTSTYLLAYTYSDNLYVRPMSYDGATWTLGTETLLSAISAGIDGKTDMVSLGDSKILVSYNNGTSIKALIVSLGSGLVITLNSALTVQSTSATNDFPGVYRFSATCASLMVQTSATTASIYLIDIDDTSVASLGSALTRSVSAGPSTMSSCFFNPQVLLVGYANTASTIKFDTINLTTNFSSFVGFSTETVIANQITNIEYSGIANLAGLTVATTYYRDSEERITTTTNVSQGTTGFALSTTQLSIRP